MLQQCWRRSVAKTRGIKRLIANAVLLLRRKREREERTSIEGANNKEEEERGTFC